MAVSCLSTRDLFDAIKSRKCLWFQPAVVRFDLIRTGTKADDMQAPSRSDPRRMIWQL